MAFQAAGQGKMSRFITNQETLFKNLLESYIPDSKQLDFLVGYFFFSGFHGIYKYMGDKKTRILVGMDADITVRNAVRIFSELEQQNPETASGFSHAKARKSWYENLKNIINKADSLDTKESFDSIMFFLEKLKAGTLEVRKTKSPNHSKVYIFSADDEHSHNGMEPGRVIVGSSNLSFQGLEGREEFNVLLTDNTDYEDAEKRFNRLWDEAVRLADASTKDEFLETVIKHTWVEKLPAPYLKYVRVLYENFKSSEETIKTPAGLTHSGDAQ
jgi:hypothetical protein